MFSSIKHILALHHPRNLHGAFRLRQFGRCPVMLVVSFIIGLLPAQASIIQGEVSAKGAGRPLEGAHVQLEGTGMGVATGSDGRFVIWGAPPGVWTLTASHLGFEPDRKELVISIGDTISVSFRLTAKALPLEEVVFTATRTMQLLKRVPVATELIGKDEIERRAAFTAAEALESEIGLDVQEDFSGQGITLQGVDPDKVLILIDGNRVIGRINGSIDLDQVSTAGIRQIEVVKGAVSTLYGSEAIGGVINIITEPAREPFELEVDFRAGGYVPDVGAANKDKLGFRSTDLGQGVNLGLRRGPAGLRNCLRFSRTGLIDIDPSTSHTEGVDATDRFNGDLRFDYDIPGPTSLILTGRYMSESKEWVEDAGLVSVDVSYDDRETNRSSSFSTEVVCTPDQSDRYSVKVYHTQNLHHWKKLTRPYNRIMDYSRGAEDYTELSLLMTRRLSSSHLLTTGSDYCLWDISAKSKLGGVPSSYASDLAAWDTFVQDEWQPLDGLTFLPGMRWERHEIYGEHWSPRVSTMWAPWEDLRIRISAGYGYRAPSVKELYFVFNHASAGYIVYGNPGLSPEESENYSISFEHTHRNSSAARISFFFNDLRNLIDFDSIGASEDYYLGEYRYENITSSWTRGVEVDREFRFGTDIELRLAYGFLETCNRQTGSLLLRRPKHSGRCEAAWKGGSWSAKLWGRYIDRMLFQSIWQTDDQVTDEWTEPYSLWNLTFTRKLGKGFFGYFKVENLFDRTHPRHGPRAGRVVTVGGRWNYSQR